MRKERIDWDEALSLHSEGWTFAEIARETGYAYKTIRQGLSSRGAKVRRTGPRGKKAEHLRYQWRFMHVKCEKPAHPSYALYGARGARVAKEWRTFAPFYRWAIESGYRPGLHLARIEGRRVFGPENCVWVSQEEQRRLRKPSQKTERSRRSLSPIDWDKVRRLLLEKRLSPRDVASKVGASYTGIISGMRRLGIERPREPAPTATPEGLRLHKTWLALQARCEDEEHPLYRYNGAKGIRVCEEWAQFRPFLEWALRSGARPGLWLVRVDRSGDYSPTNCKWLRPKEALKRRSPPTRRPPPRRLLRAFCESKGLREWVQDPRCAVSATTIARRIAEGASAREAISAPPRNRGTKDMIFREVTAFGQTKGLSDWVKDPRCRVTMTGLHDRLRRGWTAKEALTTPPFQQPRRARRAAARQRRVRAQVRGARSQRRFGAQ
jgi:hypothetical protein